MRLELSTRPQLASRARLRLDRKTGKHVLLYPEKGLLLNATSTAIVQRCTGRLTAAEIVRELSTEFSAAQPAELEREVLAFLGELSQRGLLTELE
jgi:coenzyme PQQ biosynthesis protein PqqD